jgi:hypothetical protein
MVSCPERKELNWHHSHHLEELAGVHLVLLALVSVERDHLKHELSTQVSVTEHLLSEKVGHDSDSVKKFNVTDERNGLAVLVSELSR